MEIIIKDYFLKQKDLYVCIDKLIIVSIYLYCFKIYWNSFIFVCRDGPAWYGVGLLIRWSYDHPGSNPGPGVYFLFYSIFLIFILKK